MSLFFSEFYLPKLIGSYFIWFVLVLEKCDAKMLILGGGKINFFIKILPEIYLTRFIEILNIWITVGYYFPF